MTAQDAKQEIVDRYGVLINRDMLNVTIKKNILTLTGKIKAVQSMNNNVMFRYMPNHCKVIMKREKTRKDEATYSYKFDKEGL